MKFHSILLCIVGMVFLVSALTLLQPEEDLQLVTIHKRVALSSPLPGAQITSPLIITGEAQGPWFFEANFSVILTNWDGLIIAEGYAEAQGEWMTEDFVPFTATLEFTKPTYGRRGTLILHKANASGLPEHDDAAEITVWFE